jgi:CHAT domain-containing protein
MDARLAPIGAALEPLWAALEARGIRRAVLSPNRWLHIFPLQACRLADGRRRVADAFEISFTPSFSILGKCAGRTRAATGPALIVGNPTSDLHFTEAEIASAMCHYPEASVLTHRDAKKPAILAEAAKCRVFLYTGHATFDPRTPTHSALVLETKDEAQRAKWLSLGDAFCRLNLRQCALAILNGCESGLLLPDRSDEYLALSSGFLHAGAVCVLSTQWAVHDLSAALLMDRFHAEWIGGKSVAAALREAQRWLREDIRSGDELMQRVLPEFLREIPKGTALYDACVARAKEYAARAGARPPFESPAHWAAMTAVGKAW